MNKRELSAESLSYTLHGRDLVRDISLRFSEGLLYGVLGPNGSGKSTLLKLLNGIWTPTKGHVFWEGSDLLKKSRRDISKTIAMVPQSPEVHFDFTVEEVAAMGRYPHGPYTGRRHERELLEWALNTVDAWHIRNRRLNQLSNGERQRTYIARALVTEAPILLLDEPTASLDIRHQLEIWDLMRKLQVSGKIIIVAVHDLQATERFCDHVVVLNRGSCIAQGTFEEILALPLFQEVFGVIEAGHLGSRSFDLQKRT